VIFGSGFRAGASVTVGGTACTSITVQGPNEIICTLPRVPGVGALAVAVTNPNSGGTSSLGSAFTYQLIQCGDTGVGCYDNSEAVADQFAELSDGTDLEYVTASGSFKVWKRVGTNQILQATGTYNSTTTWQKTLDRDGMGFTATDFTAYTTLAGRACPTHVFIDQYTFLSENECVYYDNTTAAQTLDSATGILAQDFIQSWNVAGTGNGTAASWFEGNIKTCADQGMRLPTLYETTANDPVSNKPINATPTFGGTRVPLQTDYTWTATANTSSGASRYFNFSGTTSSWADFNIASRVRCVLPADPYYPITNYGQTYNLTGASDVLVSATAGTYKARITNLPAGCNTDGCVQGRTWGGQQGVGQIRPHIRQSLPTQAVWQQVEAQNRPVYVTIVVNSAVCPYTRPASTRNGISTAAYTDNYPCANATITSMTYWNGWKWVTVLPWASNWTPTDY